jgi:hypothetical protein
MSKRPFDTSHLVRSIVEQSAADEAQYDATCRSGMTTDGKPWAAQPGVLAADVP